MASLFGPSGCGKNLLSNMTPCPDQTTTGCLHVASADVAALNYHAILYIKRQDIGFVIRALSYARSHGAELNDFGVNLNDG